MTMIQQAAAILRRAGWLALLAFSATACGGSDDSAPGPQPQSAQLALAGELNQPATVALAELQALPAATQTVSFASGKGPQTHTYTGASLWELLSRAGIKSDPAVHNDLLGKYVVATGADGYRAVFALGEIHPDFGNRASKVAYAETVNGTSAPLASDGPLRVTAPGDVKGGRYVSGLVKLEVRNADATTQANGGAATTQFTLGGAVARPASYDLAALQALPALTRTVGTSTYTGVSLWALLEAAGIRLDTAVKNDMLRFYVVATGSDGYRAVVSLAELSPDFGNHPAIVAYAVNGAPLATNGFARLVMPGDTRPGRHVSKLASLEVIGASAGQ